MERDLLVRWTKNGRHSAQNPNQSTFYSINNSDTNKDNCETVYKKFSLSGSSDEEMIDITAGGENMESHFEQAHASHSEPVKVNFIPMPDLPESSSDSDNEYSKLQGNYLAIVMMCNKED
ncbi:uncharacterized protein TNIN_373941 [Trichonephila inaurata madagascariensis]|uniref:Uncharacterized protein n=1 Tax=Trichonephila inaurata madagascariensis TaxID=2747483 RepID=A0A8X6ISB9_9ARAC|nr:uncharacterized protein TNIN_373941 [Trichonephila inaurata madagascariensis]